MNLISRGLKNSMRSPMRSGAIILMLAISIGLILSMLVARSSVDLKISSIKADAGTSITITPAGVMGFAGGGDPLTAEQSATIASTAHVSSTTATLSDQLGTDDTNLTSSLELGSFGARQQRFNNSSSTVDTSGTEDSTAERPVMTPRTTVTGTTNPDSVSTNGGSLTISSGSTIDGNSSELVALVGTNLATKNSLTAGSTFTAYGKTITVSGIFTTDNQFQDSGIITPLATLQSLTEQAGAATSVVAKVDSSENVETVVASLESSLGDKADITSEVEQAAQSVESLSAISNLALTGVIGATIAGAVIVLLAMVMIVRERRREIGVIKAIGGTTRKVVGQFVTEALALTVVSAIVGLGLGVLVSGPMTSSLVSSQSSTSSETNDQPGSGGAMPQARGFTRGINQINANIAQVTASVTPQVFVSAIAITLIIATVGSAVPAWFISKIRPAEVLRSE